MLKVIVSVFKSEDELDPNNYRPISLLSMFNRVFEKLKCNRLKSFLDKHNLLYHCQCGFREKMFYSTWSYSVILLIEFSVILTRGNFSCGMFIDLKKAFETVNHSIV